MRESAERSTSDFGTNFHESTEEVLYNTDIVNLEGGEMHLQTNYQSMGYRYFDWK